MSLLPMREWRIFIAGLCVALTCSVPAFARDADEPDYSQEEREHIKWKSPISLLNEATWVMRKCDNSHSRDITWANDWLKKYSFKLHSDEEAAAAINDVIASLNDYRWQLMGPAQNPPTAKGRVGLAMGVMPEGQVVALGVLRGMPAALAGMRAGDVIAAIDGKPAPKNLGDCVARIAGQPGTKVRLQFQHNGSLLETTLTRVDGSGPAEVVCKMLGSFAYLRPAEVFDEQGWKLTQDAIKALPSSGAAGLILDLRDLKPALKDDCEFTGYFLPENTPVLRYKVCGEAQMLNSTGKPVVPTLPMVALINKGSVLFAELIAESLKHYSRASLVGGKTMGYCPVYETYRLDKDFYMSYPAGAYVGIDGSSLDQAGVEPDVPASERNCLPDEGPWYTNIKPGAAPAPDVTNAAGEILDKQLRTAISVLKEKTGAP